ncbi:hypothetical protein L3Q82_006757 [Scortum barcoo]|uniref:Uncharacterized protein n=1 Tax=Scortum barcoo TaxID=214431 RepID=A0ACB8WWQ2_9TELE|nr:hypothetical protein L3Q82_006757 [Scortum barcoo]
MMLGLHLFIKQNAYCCPVSKREVWPGLVIVPGVPHACWPLKSDGTSRFCTDYFRKVNAVTVPDSFPLPCIEDCINSISPAMFITKLDLLKGYWQVPLTSRASDISAFVTPDHFLQYTRAPPVYLLLICRAQLGRTDTAMDAHLNINIIIIKV